MDSERVQTSLRQIGKVYKEILDETTSQQVLSTAIATVKRSKEDYDYAVRNRTRHFTPKPWGYTIPHEYPLRFKTSQVLDLGLQVDIYCEIKWTEDDIPVQQDIKVRIWSEHFETICDERRDSPEIVNRILEQTFPKRVVSRFHFDKANPGQTGPEYHLQIGGIPADYELYWHPEKVNVPRFICQPMELFLTCQMIAANFFWEEYQEIRETQEWKMELLLYQDSLLQDYYKKCLASIDSHKSLLDSLWMT